MQLCKYKDIFGIPNKGIHSTRILGLAFYDILFTILVAFIYSYIYFNLKNVIKNTIKYTIILWIIGFLFHLLFCVKTPITEVIEVINLI